MCAGAPAFAQPKAPAGPDELSDQGKLDSAKSLYDAGKYADCVKQFDTLIAKEPRQIHDPDVLEKARIYYAACLIANNQTPRADEQMRSAIRANPTMSPPDNLIFPRPVIDRFIVVRTQLTDEIRAAEAADVKKRRAEAEAAARRAEAERQRVAKLEDHASQEFIVQKNSRWLAAVPFGVGQFQNRDPVLGWIFLSSEVALGGLVLFSMGEQIHYLGKTQETPKPVPADLNAAKNGWYSAFVISSWSFIGVSAIGITQAQIAYVPEFRSVRHRELPPDLRRPPEPKNGVSLRPTALPTPGGFQLGLIGRF